MVAIRKRLGTQQNLNAAQLAANNAWSTIERADITWDMVQISDPKTFYWTNADNVVKTIVDAGRVPWIHCGYSAPWARNGTSSKVMPTTLTGQQGFVNYVIALLQRHPEIQNVELFNEWNSPIFWGLSPDPVATANLFTMVVDTARRAGFTHVKFHVGGTSPWKRPGDPVTAYTTFLDRLNQLIASGSNARPDGFCHHPYWDHNGPLHAYPDHNDNAFLLTADLKTLFEAKGFAGIPIHATETGIDTSPSGVSQTVQATQILQAVDYWMKQPGYGNFIIYKSKDTSGTGVEQNLGLATVSGVPKIAYTQLAVKYGVKK